MVYYILAGLLVVYAAASSAGSQEVWIVLAIVGLIVWAQEKRKTGGN